MQITGEALQICRIGKALEAGLGMGENEETRFKSLRI